MKQMENLQACLQKSPDTYFYQKNQEDAQNVSAMDEIVDGRFEVDLLG